MHNFFVSLSLVFLSLFHPHASHAATHLVTPTPTVAINEITASGSLSKYGQTVDFAFTFPQDGGKVSGSISGACTGDIQGNYSGGQKGELAGNAHASCPVLFTTFTGNASFDANIDLDNTALNLPVHVVVNGTSEDISIPLTLSN